jgi:hypothetical protein
MRLALIVLLAFLAGCASSRVQVSSATSSGASAGQVSVQASDGLARAIVVMALIGAAVEYNREDRPFPDPRALLPGNSEPVPPLAPDRTVNEQDCSKPVDWSAGNLRCK